jgi:hypothetical protein
MDWTESEETMNIRIFLPDGFPHIVCLVGSTRFGEAFAKANLEETLAGKIVLSVGSMTHSDAHIKACIKCGRVEGADAREGDFCKTAAVGQDNAHEFHPLDSKHHVGTKGKLDALHFRKIEMADEILVLNVKRCLYCRYDENNVPMPTNECRGHEPHVGQPLRTDHHWQPYVGESTKSEIEHALKLGKTIRFLNPQGPERTAALATGGQPYGYGDVPTMMRRLGLAK